MGATQITYIYNNALQHLSYIFFICIFNYWVDNISISYFSKSIFFKNLVVYVILYGCEVWRCNISREFWRKIEQIQKRFITYNLKVKSNMPYPILLIEVGLSSIESMAMTRYLMYTHKINNMGNERLPKTASNSSQNQLRLKWCWCKDTMAWLNYWGINENDIVVKLLGH